MISLGFSVADLREMTAAEGLMFLQLDTERQTKTARKLKKLAKEGKVMPTFDVLST